MGRFIFSKMNMSYQLWEIAWLNERTEQQGVLAQVYATREDAEERRQALLESLEPGMRLRVVPRWVQMTTGTGSGTLTIGEDEADGDD